MDQKQNTFHRKKVNVPMHYANGPKGKEKRGRQEYNKHSLLSSKEKKGEDEKFPQEVKDIAPYPLSDIVKSWLPIGFHAFLFYVVILISFIVAIVHFAETRDVTLIYTIVVVVSYNFGLRISDLLPGLAKVSESIHAFLVTIQKAQVEDADHGCFLVLRLGTTTNAATSAYNESFTTPF